MARGLLPIKGSSIKWLPSILKSSKRTDASLSLETRKHSPPLNCSRMPQRKILRRSCHLQTLQRIFRPCFGEQLSVLRLDQPARSSPISNSGTSAKRKQRQKERSF